ncbi:hypothetical protein BESB_048170 [Besnoitia besnoiti]|uniref:Transportin-3 n=1 Tax=Besnoitia besnoiti TaxID=94643 RepID=A0A2A9MF63_BESBE|nr:hypothetical protein BESB_048170 [Besnoitia besnoiti]PFH36625.1 hypothetical protein BESB_048170 [Besnoitia besnoiti]
MALLGGVEEASGGDHGELVLRMLQTLYSSSDSHARRQADVWLRQWQKSAEAWEIAMEMLVRYSQLLSAPGSASELFSDEAVYFLCQTLRTKTMFDFHQLPLTSHEALCSQVLRLLQVFATDAERAPCADAAASSASSASAAVSRRHRAASTQLSLCLADLALQTADHWLNPVQVILQAFPPAREATAASFQAQSLLLLLLRHLAEESTSRRVMADETVRQRHLVNLTKSASTVMQTLLQLRDRVRERRRALEEEDRARVAGSQTPEAVAALAANNALLRSVLSCWRVWLTFLQPAEETQETASRADAPTPPPAETDLLGQQHQSSLALVFSDCVEVLACQETSAAGGAGGSEEEDPNEAAANCILRLLKSVTSSRQTLRSRCLRLEQERSRFRQGAGGDEGAFPSSFSPPSAAYYAQALGDSEAALKKAEAFEQQLLQEILTHCVGSLRVRLLAALQRQADDAQPGAAGAAFRDDYEALQTLTTLSRLYAGVAVFLIPVILRRSHKDPQLQELIHLLMRISEAPRTRGLVAHALGESLQSLAQHADDDLEEEGEEDALLVIEESMRFWMKLAEAASRTAAALGACADSGLVSKPAGRKADKEDTPRFDGEQAEETRQSLDALKEVYSHLLRECLRQLVMPKRVASASLSGDYDVYRRALLDCLEDCALVLSPERAALFAVEHLHQTRQRQEEESRAAATGLPAALQPKLQQSHERLLEGALVALAKLLSLVGDFASLKAHMQAPVGAISVVLGVEGFPHALELLHTTIYARLAAIDVLKQLFQHLLDDPGALQHALQMLVRQLLAAQPARDEAAGGSARDSEERQTMIQSLHLHAARAVCQLCTAATANVIASPTVNELVSLTKALANAKADEDVQMFVLEGVSAVASKITDTAAFLSVLEALCEPSIGGLQQTESDEHAICWQLDCLAVILRDAVCPGTAAAEPSERHLRVATFLTSSLWPLLSAQLDHHAAQQRIVEKSLRCLKHAVRCAGDLFKPQLPGLLTLLQKNAQSRLHCTYLYAAEWLAMQFAKDEQYQQVLMHLFQQLSRQALQAIQEQAGNVDACSDLVEDCYGMINRYIRHCPLLVSLSPDTVQQALVVARSAMYVQQREAAQVVFIFLDSCAFFCDEHRPVEPLSNAVGSLALEHLPALVEEAFRLLMEAPPSYVVALVEGFITTVAQVFGNRSVQWLARGLSGLPPSVLPSEAMKTQLLAKLSRPETGGVCEAVEDLAYRCEQVCLRNRA